MEDKLEVLSEMWKDQKEFNSNFVNFEKMDETEKVAMTKEYSLQLNGEVYELLRETSWKNHRKAGPNIIKSNLKEEWIDVFKYWLSIGALWGFNPEDFIEEYWRKSAVVEQRYLQEKQLDFESSKIAGVDIDGVLAAYPEHYINYVNKELGTDFKVNQVKDYDLYNSLPIPEDIALDLKDSFRQSGQNRTIPVLEGAKKFLQELRRRDYKIVLLSARPYKQYRRIFADTQTWLNENGLVHDAILWDEDKCGRLVREFGKENVSFFVEDHIGNANSIADKVLCPVFLFNRSYNKDKLEKKGVYRVDTFSQIIERVF